MKDYINQQKTFDVIRKNIRQYLKDHRSQFANISIAIGSVNHILGIYGYHLSNPDGTHHNQVYFGLTGSADINISDKDGNQLGYVLKLDWKQLETGLGWSVDFKIRFTS